MDISEQIKKQIGKIIKEQLSRVKPEIGVFRKIENLRLILKASFPNETQLDNIAGTIAFLNRFLTNNEIKIIPEFTNNTTGETYPAYKIPDPNYIIQDKVNNKARDKASDKASDKDKENKDTIYFLDKVLQKLAGLAKDEVWKFADDKDKNDKKSYPLLIEYLLLMYSRLKHERDVLGQEFKILEASVNESIKEENTTREMKCAFNTGLLSKDGKPIYMVLKENDRPDKQKWVSEDVCVDSDDNRLLIPFKKIRLPRRADFSLHLTPSVAIFSKEVDAVNVDHILISHCERLPLDFLKHHFEDYFEKTTPATDKEWDEFKKYLKNPDNVRKFNSAKAELKAAVEKAINEGQADMKKALIYRPENNTICTFIPLYLEKPKDEKDFEVGLIVDKRDGYNIVRTIYRTSMAYSKIRLIGTQSSSTWLDPSRITRWENPYPYNSNDED